MGKPDIEHIDLTSMTVLMADGVELPITRTFDENGDDCDPDEAVSLVAGADDYGWISMEVGSPMTVH